MHGLIYELVQADVRFPEIDLSITISVVIAACAIISPVLTSLINNHYSYKMKILDMGLEQEKSSFFYRRGVFENYLKATGECILSQNPEEIKAYGAIYPLALLYFPDELRPDLEKLNDLISGNYWNEACDSLNDISPKIRKILQTM